jgi:hypothetical protein
MRLAYDSRSWARTDDVEANSLEKTSPRPPSATLADFALPAALLLAVLVVLIGGIAVALALSAASILTYYAVAHLAVLARVRGGDFPRILGLTAALGLTGCVVVVAGLLLSAGALPTG